MTLRAPPPTEPVKDFTKPSIERAFEFAMKERDEARAAARDLYNMRNWTFKESVAIKKRWPWLIEG